jgi:hypothetical protein
MQRRNLETGNVKATNWPKVFWPIRNEFDRIEAFSRFSVIVTGVAAMRGRIERVAAQHSLSNFRERMRAA